MSCHREEDGLEEEELVEGPALLGEAALLGAPLGFPRQLATLRTATRCTLWRLAAADFAAALRMHPQVGARVLQAYEWAVVVGRYWVG